MTHTLLEIDRMARETIARFPAQFAPAAAEVALRVVELPDRDMLASLNINDPLELTGLYEGVPLTEKSVMDVPMGPDVVWLFRDPILAELRARGDVTLADLVAHVTVHEFAHHFGWSDADIATVDAWWE